MLDCHDINKTLNALSEIYKSAIMFLIGMCLSWIVSTIYDFSILATITFWIICDNVSNILIKPILDLALKINTSSQYKHNRGSTI